MSSNEPAVLLFPVNLGCTLLGQLRTCAGTNAVWQRATRWITVRPRGSLGSCGRKTANPYLQASRPAQDIQQDPHPPFGIQRFDFSELARKRS